MTRRTAPDPALVVAAHATRITSYVGQKRRDENSRDATIPWVYLDELAEALRALGVDPLAPNLGTAPREELAEKRRRTADERYARVLAGKEETA